MECFILVFNFTFNNIQFVLHINNIILVLLHMHNSEFEESQQQQKYEKNDTCCQSLQVNLYHIVFLNVGM